VRFKSYKNSHKPQPAIPQSDKEPVPEKIAAPPVVKLPAAEPENQLQIFGNGDLFAAEPKPATTAATKPEQASESQPIIAEAPTPAEAPAPAEAAPEPQPAIAESATPEPATITASVPPTESQPVTELQPVTEPQLVTEPQPVTQLQPDTEPQSIAEPAPLPQPTVEPTSLAEPQLVTGPAPEPTIGATPPIEPQPAITEFAAPAEPQQIADPAPEPLPRIEQRRTATPKPAAPKAPSKRGRKSLKQVAAEADLIEVPTDEVLFSKQYYTMGEVSEMFRVNQSLLRFWETEFDILQPRKNKKGDRYFRPVDIKTLHLIYHLLRQKKYTIEGAKEFLKKNKKADERFEVIQRLQEIRTFLLEWKAQL
jgi:DNA-binding transcriptional MerR regulator